MFLGEGDTIAVKQLLEKVEVPFKDREGYVHSDIQPTEVYGTNKEISKVNLKKLQALDIVILTFSDWFYGVLVLLLLFNLRTGLPCSHLRTTGVTYPKPFPKTLSVLFSTSLVGRLPIL
jgi:hypothetical protein